MLPPDINESVKEFKVIGNSVRFGLDAVKGVGSSAIESVLATREKDGPFTSIDDFLKRIDTRKANKKVIENLIKVGAFDSLGLKRAQAMELAHSFANGSGSQSLFGQQDIFGSQDNEKAIVKEWDEMELLSNEKDALGFYLSGHPLTKYRVQLSALNAKKTSELSDLKDREEVQIAGVITSIRKIQKRGTNETMAYFNLEDEEGIVEAIAFTDLYRNNSTLLKKDMPVIIKGILDHTEKGMKIILKEIVPLANLNAKNGLKCEINIKYPLAKGLTLKNVQQALLDSTGKCPVYLKIDTPGSQVFIASGFEVEPSGLLIDRIEGMLGQGTIRIVSSA